MPLASGEATGKKRKVSSLGGGASAPELSFSGGGGEVSGAARVDVAAWFGADFLAWEISTVARARAGGGGWGAQCGGG